MSKAIVCFRKNAVEEVFGVVFLQLQTCLHNSLCFIIYKKKRENSFFVPKIMSIFASQNARKCKIVK